MTATALTTTRSRWRPTWAEIDLGAVRHNVRLLRRAVAPASLCAVIKADGYGHGAVPVARAALDAGAAWLAVALVEEGVALRDAGIDAPILVLSEPPSDAVGEAVARRLTPTLYSVGAVETWAASAASSSSPFPVHVKVDTGMHRVGADPGDLAAVVEAVRRAPSLTLQGLWTHLAVADGDRDEDRDFTTGQLRRFERARAELAAAGVVPPMVHAANSAAAIAYPASRLDMVRCGIAVYGCLPAPGFDTRIEHASAGGSLRPALSWKARVSMVRVLDAGERPSYGRVAPLTQRSLVATVPVGYADGLSRRAQPADVRVLIGGVARRLAGTVTMDQIVVDCGPADSTPPVTAGDEVVLIGAQAGVSVTAQDWAEHLGTISYEVVCAIGPRVPRRFVGDDAVAAPRGESDPGDGGIGKEESDAR